MSRTRKSGLSLIVLALLGVAFFWLTDVRFGVAGWWSNPHGMMDAAWQSWPGTFIGLGGSMLILLVGAWLATRRAA